MLARESPSAAPFYEEEVVESNLSCLNWRLEAKASRPVTVRGGVLADAVGYGKTCITLALVAATKGKYEDSTVENEYIPTNATLIIVPPHLCKQWEREVDKFCGSDLRVIIVYSKQTFNNMTVQDFQQADVVIVSVSVYNSDAYFESLSRFSASNTLPPKSGRYFEATLPFTLRGIRNRVRELQTKGAKDVLESILEHRDFCADLYATTTDSKRRGSSLQADAEAALPTATKLKKLSNDVWGLNKVGVKADWRMLRSAPLEAFHWKRVVIDEFHYVAEDDSRACAAIKSLSSRSTWLLSGTPPIADLADVKGIASFFGVHLGIEDDEESSRESVRRRRERARTAVERFAHFAERRSSNWHENRNRHAQTFLDRFVRQNVAEIDEIPFETIVVTLRQPAAERACYLELAHMIEALEVRHARRIFRSKKTYSVEDDEKTSDRDRRLMMMLGESDSPEEALIRQASHFVLTNDESEPKDAVQTCEWIVAERTKQQNACLRHFRQTLRQTVEQHFVVLLKRRFRDADAQALVSFAKNCEGTHWGDEQCRRSIIEVMEKENGMAASLTDRVGQRLYPHWTQFQRDEQRDWTEEKKLRDMVHTLRRLRDEYCSRVRGLRYFSLVRDIQRAHMDQEDDDQHSHMRCTSPKCSNQGQELSMDDVALFSTCGHAGCVECVERDAAIGQCSDPHCSASVKPTSIVRASSLGQDSQVAPPFGIKLATVATTISQRIPKDERILLFVQYDGLLERVAIALRAYGIDFARLQGNASRRSDLLTAFQEGHQRILLLSIDDESAAGSNLTVANHVIFLSPLITEEARQYEATMAQAKGRAIRYGQTRKVTIWRFVVLDTIDQAVYETREHVAIGQSRENEREEQGSLDFLEVVEKSVEERRSDRSTRKRKR